MTRLKDPVVRVSGTQTGMGRAAAVFLASDEASYIAGANLVIDGGWSSVLPGAPPDMEDT